MEILHDDVLAVYERVVIVRMQEYKGSTVDDVAAELGSGCQDDDRRMRKGGRE